ncbi:MAG: response regulator [Verrucomicrobiota bacterium]|nr:response regulator [Verrucomicrobiota bacterium]
MNKNPKILVVDDQPVNVKLLEFKLSREGMTVLIAYNGKEALELVRSELPDIILLDIMMPDLDGMEVCRQIREDNATRDIPIIFITAKSSKEGKIAGLKAGADDYITKPIDLDETLARINTQLRIRDNHRLNLDLQNRLSEMRQNVTVGAITQGIAHNLNNLLGVVIGYLDLTKSAYNQPDKVLRSCGLMDQALKRMTRIIHQLTTLSHNETLRTTPIPLQTLLESTVNRFQQDYHVIATVEINNPTGLSSIHSNAETFEDAVGRLLINAFESYPPETEAKDRKIQINVVTPPPSTIPGITTKLLITIDDEGKGLDSSVELHAFEPFVSSDTAVGRGLGLTIARHHLRRLGGDVILERRKPKGTRATVYHPIR